jgi:hypothetical protein
MRAAMKSTGSMDGAALGVPRLQLDYHSFRDMNKILCIKPSPFAGKSRFACYLGVYFPETARRIDEEDFGVLHLEVGVLKLASREAIEQGDWETLDAHYAFLAALAPHCGEELRRALDISYLGALFYGECGRNFAKARTMLPRTLACALEEIERHYEDMAYRAPVRQTV